MVSRIGSIHWSSRKLYTHTGTAVVPARLGCVPPPCFSACSCNMRSAGFASGHESEHPPGFMHGTESGPSTLIWADIGAGGFRIAMCALNESCA